MFESEPGFTGQRRLWNVLKWARLRVWHRGIAAPELEVVIQKDPVPDFLASTLHDLRIGFAHGSPRWLAIVARQDPSREVALGWGLFHRLLIRNGVPREVVDVTHDLGDVFQILGGR